jgi:hypothetical protein
LGVRAEGEDHSRTLVLKITIFFLNKALLDERIKLLFSIVLKM